MNQDQMRDVRVLHARGFKPAAIAAAFHVSTRRVYQILHEEPATGDEVVAARAAAAKLARSRDAGERLLAEIFSGDLTEFGLSPIQARGDAP